MDEALRLAAEAARVLADRTGVLTHDVALVLGSGWAGAADSLGQEVASVTAGEIPGFSASSVEGHGSTLSSVVTSTGLHVLILGARHHFYESRDAVAVGHPIRVAAAAGCRIVILTNGCGSTRPEVGPGAPVLISDHINLTGASPLVGPAFVDLTDLYSTRLRAVARESDPSLEEGVYAQFPGPQYETPAEIRMATALGASLIGMSTALEAIAARAAGLEVLGLSLVTNLAAGISDAAPSHDEVLAAGREAGPRISRLLGDIVGRL
ncbi:MAG: purine-nucleoside phosphorylase [Demequinaceae bacterium]|nr:purine-nucleoside phosphorylase [Demequinaceae bacterium]